MTEDGTIGQEIHYYRECIGGGGGGSQPRKSGGGGGGGGGRGGRPQDPILPTDRTMPKILQPSKDKEASEELEDCYKNVDEQLKGKFPGISELFEGTTVASLVGLGSGIVGSYLHDRVIEPEIQQALYRRNKSNILDIDVRQIPSRVGVFRAFAISTLLADGLVVFTNAVRGNIKMGEYHDEKLKARANCRSQVNSKYGTSFGKTAEDEKLENRRDNHFGYIPLSN